MPIPLFLLERIQTASMTGAQIADAFVKLARAADQADMDECAINIEYVTPQDKLIPGDLIPMITLSLVRQQVPNPFFRPAEAACDEGPYPEE